MPKGLFSGFNVSASGLAAQRRRLDVIAENLANAETTRTAEGGPYRRKRAVIDTEVETQKEVRMQKGFLGLVRKQEGHLGGGPVEQPVSKTVDQVRVVTAVEEDQSPFRMEYDPGHPDADPDGYVLKPNVNVVDEMVDMIMATRAYQANAVAIEAAKDMFMVSLEI